MAKPMTKSKIVAALAEKVRDPEEDVGGLPRGPGDPGPQGGQERLHDPGGREAGRAQLQGAHGTESPDRRGHQDPGPAPPQVRGGQGRQGRRPRQQVEIAEGREGLLLSRLPSLSRAVRPERRGPSVRHRPSSSSRGDLTPGVHGRDRQRRQLGAPAAEAGVDGAIHRAGGPAILEECRRIRDAARAPCPRARPCITGAGRLSCRHVIHTVGPIWAGGRHGRGRRRSPAATASSLAPRRGARPPVGRLPQHLDRRLRLPGRGGRGGRHSPRCATRSCAGSPPSSS